MALYGLIGTLTLVPLRALGRLMYPFRAVWCLFTILLYALWVLLLIDMSIWLLMFAY